MLSIVMFAVVGTFFALGGLLGVMTAQGLGAIHAAVLLLLGLMCLGIAVILSALARQRRDLQQFARELGTAWANGIRLKRPVEPPPSNHK